MDLRPLQGVEGLKPESRADLYFGIEALFLLSTPSQYFSIALELSSHPQLSATEYLLHFFPVSALSLRLAVESHLS